MASSTIVHAAVFAVGALVGGGVATAVTSRKRDEYGVARTTGVTTQVPPNPPVVDVKSGEGAVMKSPPAGTAVQVDTAILKYGHPGAWNAKLVTWTTIVEHFLLT